MNSSIKRIVFVLIFAGLIGGAVAFKLISESESQAATKPDKSATKVTVIEAKPVTLIDTLETTGNVTAHESVELQAEVAGRIETIAFEEHADVSEGDLLIALDNDVLRARLESNRQQAKLATKTLERQQKVLSTGGVSQQSVDETQNRIAVLDAERQRILAELDNMRIRAPFDGRVGLRHVSPGDYITPGSTIATLTMLDPIKVEFTVHSRHIPRVAVGQAISFKVDGSDASYCAEIYARETEIDRDSQTLTYAARAQNPSGNLMPGAFADVATELERRENTLAIPAISLVTSGEKTFTWIVADGKAQKRSVNIGLRTRSRVEIVDGLEAGDKVVVTGRQGLTPGAPVQIKTEDAFPIEKIEADTSRVGMERKRLTTDEYAPEDSESSAEAADEQPAESSDDKDSP